MMKLNNIFSTLYIGIDQCMYKQLQTMQKQNYLSQDPYRFHELQKAQYGRIEPPQTQYNIFEKNQLLPIGNISFDVHIREFISIKPQSFGQVNLSMGELQNSNQGAISLIQMNQGLEQESTNLGHLEYIQEKNNQLFNYEDGNNLINDKISAQKIIHTSRSKDDNNAHKKFTSCLNDCLTTIQRAKLRKHLKKYNIKNEKSQRFWFVFRLLDIQLFSTVEEMKTLKNNFIKCIKEQYQLSEDTKPTEAEIYLNQLISLHIESFSQFMESNYEQATAILYATDDLKQIGYKNKGIERVQNYLADILNRKLNYSQTH